MREWLVELRKQHNITQKEMGDKLGISESYYCSIEKGERQKRMDMMLAAGIATVFGIPISRVVAYESECRG